MPMDQVAKGLDGSHHCGHAVRATTHRLVNRTHGSPGHLTEIAQQLAVITETKVKPLGNREHKLSVGHFGAYSFRQPIRPSPTPVSRGNWDKNNVRDMKMPQITRADILDI